MDNALITLLGKKSPSEFAKDFVFKKHNSRLLKSTSKLQNYNTLLNNSIKTPGNI